MLNHQDDQQLDMRHHNDALLQMNNLLIHLLYNFLQYIHDKLHHDVEIILLNHFHRNHVVNQMRR
jgi:hypothetical protein